MRSARGYCLILLFSMLPVAAWSQERGAPAALDQALNEWQQGRLAEAIAILEARSTDAGGERQTVALLGVLYLEAGRPADALAVLRPLVDKQDADPAALYNAGRAALALGETSPAETYFERSLKDSPGSPAARELGLLHGRQRRYQEAYPLLVPWAYRNPDDLEARLAAAVCAVQLERIPPAEELLSDLPQENPQVRFLWGRILLLKGDPFGAIATLKPLARSPLPEMDLDVRRILAEAYVVAGQAASAVELLRGWTENRPAVALQLTQAQYQSGDLDGALATIEPFAEQILKSRDASSASSALAPDILVLYGRLLAGGGLHQRALPALELATDLDPDDKRGWQALGQALAAVGRDPEAEQALGRFRRVAEAETRTSVQQLEDDLKDPTGREVRQGLELLHSGAAEQALEVARRELSLAPDDLRPRLLEASSLLHLQRPEEALDAAQRAVRMAPENADATYLRGTIWMALNSLEAAEQDLRRALDLSAEHTAAMNDLAILLSSRGEKDAARRLLERALELNPADPVARANLARLQEP